METEKISNVLVSYFIAYSKIKTQLTPQARKEFQQTVAKIKEEKQDEDVLYYAGKAEEWFLVEKYSNHTARSHEFWSRQISVIGVQIDRVFVLARMMDCMMKREMAERMFIFIVVNQF